MFSKILSLVLVPCFINTIFCANTHHVEKFKTLGLVASHMTRTNHSAHSTHIIESKIEETLPNGCYKQILRESYAQNPDKFEETLIWICPPGTPKESIPIFGKPCPHNCTQCSKTKNNPTQNTVNILKPHSTLNPHNNTEKYNATELEDFETYVITEDIGNKTNTHSSAVSRYMSNIVFIPTFLLTLCISFQY